MGDRTERVTIRLTPQERAALEWLATEAHTTAAGLVRAWVAPWVGRVPGGAAVAAGALGAPGAGEGRAGTEAARDRGAAASDETGAGWVLVPVEWPDGAR